ncbi:MAG: hypothetical protein EOM24_26195, partial [Chloroflexia bacterium]|nr:hypothetical protein [Chloroflexia bacterium]
MWHQLKDKTIMTHRLFTSLAVLMLFVLVLVGGLPVLSTAARASDVSVVLAAPEVATPLLQVASTPGLPVVEAGGNTTCVINQAGQLYCWGAYSTLPDDLGTFTQVSVAGKHICAVTVSGVLHCWGENYYGDQMTVPDDLGAVSQFSAGWDHTCAVTAEGVLRCWGENSYRRATVPNDLGLVSQVSVGQNHTCALTASKVLRCWGDSQYGQATVPEDLGL